MYVAVKGGEAAIRNAHRLLADRRRGDRTVPAITLSQIVEQLALAVDRVMTEGSLYDRDLAALAVRQARGDLIEAIFLVRAYRTTLPRFGESQPVDTAAMLIHRRISATFKDLPGGQMLGPTFDYTHRLLEPQTAETPAEPTQAEACAAAMPRVTDLLGTDDLVEPSPADTGEAPGDLTLLHRLGRGKEQRLGDAHGLTQLCLRLAARGVVALLLEAEHPDDVCQRIAPRPRR